MLLDVESRLPQPLEEFKILNLLGEREHCHVYSALSPLKEPCVLKFLIRRPDSDEFFWNGLVEQFRHEGEIAKRLLGGHFVRSLGYFLIMAEDWYDDLRHVVVTEFRGMTLEDDLAALEVSLKADRNAPRLPVETARRYARGLADAVKNLRDQGLVHRDIVARNIFLHMLPHYLGPDTLHQHAEIYLGDFGLICRRGGELIHQIGWDGSKPPELFEEGTHHPRPVQKAEFAEDTYALGRLLYRIADVVEGDARWLRAVAVDCAAEDPQERPKVDDELIRRFDREYSLILDDLILGGCNRWEHSGWLGGRDYMFRTFDEFQADCQAKDEGGIFLVTAGMGIGKSALLTHWPLNVQGSHHAYFFKRDKRTSVSSMIYRLFESIEARWFGSGLWARERPRLAEPSAEALVEMLRCISSRELRVGERVLIVVDALDESDDPAMAATVFPRKVPPGIYFIVSSRDTPTALAAAEHCFRVPLAARDEDDDRLADNSRNNLDAVTEYLIQKVQEPQTPTRAQAIEIVRSLDGIFQLAVFVADDLNRGVTTAAEFLAGEKNRPPTRLAGDRRIFAWFDDNWSRLENSLVGENERGDEVFELLTLMAAVFEPIPVDLAQEILGWKASQLNRAVESARWFVKLGNNPDGGEGQEFLGGNLLYHRNPSVYRLLTDVLTRKIGLPGMHARIGRYFLAQAHNQSWNNLPPYGIDYLVQHLVRANKKDLARDAARCLIDLQYLQARLRPSS